MSDEEIVRAFNQLVKDKKVEYKCLIFLQEYTPLGLGWEFKVKDTKDLGYEENS